MSEAPRRTGSSRRHKARPCLAVGKADRRRPPSPAAWGGPGPLPTGPLGPARGAGSLSTVLRAGRDAAGPGALSKVLKAFRPLRPSSSLANASQLGLVLTHRELWFCLRVFGNISLLTDLSQTLSLPAAFLNWSLPHPCPSFLPSHGNSPKRQRRTLFLLLAPLRK